MKRTILFLMVVGLASCNTNKKLTNSFDNFLKKHDFQEVHSISPDGSNHVKASISNLYDTTQVASVCSQADVTFKVVRGRVEVEADCSEGGQTLVSLFKKLWEAVKFSK